MKSRLIDLQITLAAPTEGYVRSPGLHMSELYNALFKKLDPKRYDKRDVDGSPLPFDLKRMELGTTWEELLEPALAVRLAGYRLGEFYTKHDPKCAHRKTPLPKGIICPCGGGIAYTPDHIFDIDGALILGEFKCTWYSAKDCPDDPKFDKWIVQIKSYCHHLKLSRAYLIVLFVNGGLDRRYHDHQPELHSWELQFTPRELQDNWSMLVRFAREEGILK